METTQEKIDEMAEALADVSRQLKEAMEFAFILAKEGNRSGVFQMLGAFSGTDEAARSARGFLEGLAKMFR